MNMSSRMNSRRRARYVPFLTSTFAFIYQFMIQKAFKFIVWEVFGRNSLPKYFLMAKAATDSLPRRTPICELCQAYQRMGTETSPVIGLNYLLPVGQIWWRSEVTQFFLSEIFNDRAIRLQSPTK